MSRLDRSQFLFVGQVEPEGCHRDVALLDGPAIRSYFGALQGDDGKPEKLAPLWVLTGNNAAIVVSNRLTRPAESLGRPIGKIDIHKRQLGIIQEQFQDEAQ